MRKLQLIVWPLVLSAAVYLLFFQPEFLEKTVQSNSSVPLGTIVSWIIFFSFPMFISVLFSGKHKNLMEKILRYILTATIVMGAMWGFVSYVLASNWNFVFENQNYFIFWIAYSATILCLPVLVLIIKGIRKLF